MTNRERALLVKIMRCGADTGNLLVACRYLGATPQVCRLRNKAYELLDRAWKRCGDLGYREGLLEAARMVEERRWLP